MFSELMSLNKKTNITFFCCLLTLTTIYLSTTEIVKGQTSDFYAGKQIAGKSLDQLAQEYWKWWFHVPKEKSLSLWEELKAIIGESPENHHCYIGSDSKNNTKFFYNPYAQVDYNAKCGFIYSDQFILVPLIVGECDASLPENALNGSRIEDYWECARLADETFTKWQVILDGKVIFSNEINPDLKSEILVRNSSWFPLKVEVPNRYGVENGTYKAVVDGYYLPLKPLSTGEHVLQYDAMRKWQDTLNREKIDLGNVKYTFSVKNRS